MVRSCSSADPEREVPRAGRTSRAEFSAPAAGGLPRVAAGTLDVAWANPPTPRPKEPTMAHTYAARLTHGAASRTRTDVSDDVEHERRALRARANLGLVALWAGLAVAIAVYAIDRESIGAGVL